MYLGIGQQPFIKRPLCARHWATCWDCKDELRQPSSHWLLGSRMNESIRQFVRAPQRYSGRTLNEGPQVQPEGSGELSGGDDLKPEWGRGIRREKK